MRHCYALDLKDDPELIRQYEELHQAVWPEVLEDLKDRGVRHLELYRIGNRLIMIVETCAATHGIQSNATRISANSRVAEWEEFMWKFQQPTPWSSSCTKWTLMKRIFEFGSD